MAKETSKREQGGALQQRVARPMSPWDEFERLFSGFRRGGWLNPFEDVFAQREGLLPFEGHIPKVDVIDREGEVVVKAELPGVKKGDVEVTVTDSSVTIRATTRHEEKDEEGEFYRRELTRGEFKRTLALPSVVDEEQASASFENGVLELTLPKQEKTRRKTVEVK